VCDGLSAAMRAHGVPQQILTDNGKVFTGRFHQPPVEVLFDRICRENGVEHLLTQPRSPTTTGKIERFHRTLRLEFDTQRTFATLARAQSELDEWVRSYNHDRPHQSLDDDCPAERYLVEPRVPAAAARSADRVAGPGEQWVTRKVASNGIVGVDWQQISVGVHRAGQACDILVNDSILQLWIGNELMKTAARTRKGELRNKNAQGTSPRA
jgi:hypothetical protein